MVKTKQTVCKKKPTTAGATAEDREDASAFLEALGRITAEAQDEKKRQLDLGTQKLQKAVETWYANSAHSCISAAARRGDSSVNAPFSWDAKEFGDPSRCNATNALRMAIASTSPELNTLLVSIIKAGNQYTPRVEEARYHVKFSWDERVEVHRKRKADAYDAAARARAKTRIVSGPGHIAAAP